MLLLSDENAETHSNDGLKLTFSSSKNLHILIAFVLFFSHSSNTHVTSSPLRHEADFLHTAACVILHAG